jgi:hypothetical protein
LEAENGCGITFSGRRTFLSAPFRPGLLVQRVLLFRFVSCYFALFAMRISICGANYIGFVRHVNLFRPIRNASIERIVASPQQVHKALLFREKSARNVRKAPNSPCE